jgi:hypothetical protein
MPQERPHAPRGVQPAAGGAAPSDARPQRQSAGRSTTGTDTGARRRAMLRYRVRTRTTYRLPADLAEALRRLPNQTTFVERALREALGHVCPVCHGTGLTAGGALAVSDLKAERIGRLDRVTAAQLRSLVRLGRQLLATELALAAASDNELEFRLARDDQLLLSGRIARGRQEVRFPH